MNWITMLMRSLQLLPVLIAGIEHIHGEAPGATKKQMAMDALQLAYGGASTLLPGEQPAIDAATQLTSDLIDGTVAVFNAAGIFGPRGSAPVKLKPAPVPAVAPVPLGFPGVSVPAPDAAAPVPPPPPPRD
jgi:hypothetical protein